MGSASERNTVVRILSVWKNFLSQEHGATAIEYALIASILGIALLPVLSNTSSGVASLYSKVEGYFDVVNGG
jgi:Flp pilus assembly pilin Flp